MRTLLEYGLANLAAATALAFVAVIAGFVIRRPAVRNALWVLVLIRLVVPPIWTVPIELTSHKSDESVPQVSVVSASPTSQTARNPLSLEVIPANHLDEPSLTSGAELSPILPVRPTSEPPARVEVEDRSEFDVTQWLVVILGACWIAGAVLTLFRSLRRILAFRRALGDASPADASIQHEANSIAQSMGLRNAPIVLVVPGRVWPSLWMPGLRPKHARIILPAGLFSLLDRQQRSTVFAHELAHLRRGDPWVRWLELICCSLYWWYPLLGWFRKQLRESEEQCCDMWVVAATDGRRSYASALVETAVFLDGTGPMRQPILASGAGPVRNLQRRVTMIMRASWPARLTRFGLAVVLGVGGLSVAFGPALAQDGRKDKERPDPRVGDKERPGNDRPGEPAKERGRPDPKAKDRELPDGAPKDRERSRNAGPEIEEARTVLEKARREAREAMNRVQEAEARLAKLEGRPVPPAGRGPGDRGRGEGDRGPGDRVPERPINRDPIRPGAEGPREGAGLRDLQQQIEELRKALDEMRRDMRKGGDRRDESPARPTRPTDRDPDPKRP